MLRLVKASALAPTVFVAASLLIAPLLHAQPAAVAHSWDGPSAIAVAVKDQSGKVVPGARVTLRFTDVQPPVGPAPLVTDAKGQAIAGHLAEGSWYVEVSHPQAMLFTAYVDTRAGKAAKSTFSAQVSTGTSWAPLRVEFFKVKGMPPAAPAVPSAPAVAAAPAPAAASAPAPVAPVVPTVPAVAAPQPASSPVPAPPAAPSQPAPAATPRQPAPAASAPAAPAPPRTQPAPAAPAAPRPATQPTPAPAPPPAAPPAPAPVAPPPAPSASVAPPAQQPTPRSSPAAPPPTSAPAASAPATPTPPAAPAPPAPATTPSRPPAPAPVPAPPPAPAPAPAPAAAPPAPAPAPAPAQPTAPAPPAAPAAPPAQPAPFDTLRSASGGTCPECGNGEWAASGEGAAAPGSSLAACLSVAGAVRPALQTVARTAPTAAERGYAGPVNVPLPSGSPASCAVVAIVLPAEARFVGYRYEAVDGWGGGDCLAGQACSIGGAQWEGHPMIERGERTVVWSVFANASPERARRGRLTAYFRPGAGWTAPR